MIAAKIDSRLSCVYNNNNQYYILDHDGGPGVIQPPAWYKGDE